jgi:hypothetical protein
MLTIYNSIDDFVEEIEEHVIHEFENFVQHATTVFNPIFNKFSNFDSMNNSGRCKTKAF